MNAHYPVRKIDDKLNSLHNSRYFCRLDLYKAYFYVPVDEQSSEIQTISTHRFSFGIKTAPADFNRIMDQILRDVKKTEKYFDDIIINGETFEECAENLKDCLKVLHKNDLHINQRKCSFFQEKFEF